MDASVGRRPTRLGSPSGPRPRVAVPPLLGALLLALAALCGVAFAGDTELAKFLVQGGREDLGKKQYDDALKKLTKARLEDPTLLEAPYWMGVVHDARKDPRAALGAYRDFKAGYEEKKAAGALSKDEEALLPKVQARLEALAAAETELARLQDAYVAQVFALAEENFIRDPAVTLRALKLLLAVRPKHEPARRLLEKLGVPEAAAVAGESDPFGVRAWEDLIATKAFSPADGFEYAGERMAVGRRTGQVVFPPRLDLTGARYVVDVEVRFSEDYSNRVFGIGFGKASDIMCCIMLTPDKLDLVDIRQAGALSSTIQTTRLKKPVAVDEWHRMTLIVDGLGVEVQLDGKKEMVGTIKGRDGLDGMVGVYVQQAKVEIRRYRLGRLP